MTLVALMAIACKKEEVNQAYPNGYQSRQVELGEVFNHATGGQSRYVLRDGECACQSRSHEGDTWFYSPLSKCEETKDSPCETTRLVYAGMGGDMEAINQQHQDGPISRMAFLVIMVVCFYLLFRRR